MCENIRIHEFIQKARNELQRQDFSKSTRYAVDMKWKQLEYYADLNKITVYSPEIAESFILYLCGKPLRDTDVNLSNSEKLLRRAIRMLDSLFHTGVIHPYWHRNIHRFPANYQKLSERFLDFRRTQIRPTSLLVARRHLDRFIDFLCRSEVSNPCEITAAHISDYCKSLSTYDNCTIHTYLCDLRAFLQWLPTAGLHVRDLSLVIPKFRLYRDAHIPTTWTPEEIRRLLDAVERENPLGKRDYAMLVMVAVLGIRVGDLVKMKLENLDWRQRRISFAQSKDCTRQCLPITEEVGGAVVDYLQHGRPATPCREIFLKHTSPPKPFSEHNSFWMVFRRYMDRAGISRRRRVGMHSLRHSMATGLLAQKVPMPVIANILGHAHLRTTVGYLKVDIEHLRQCCLSFGAMEGGQ